MWKFKQNKQPPDGDNGSTSSSNEGQDVRQIQDKEIGIMIGRAVASAAKHGILLKKEDEILQWVIVHLSQLSTIIMIETVSRKSSTSLQITTEGCG